MSDTSQTVSPEIESVIQQTLREALEEHGLRAVTVRAGENHAGEPALFIEAEYDLTEEPFDFKVSLPLLTRLRDLLWDRGERRFPHIRHKFATGQKFVEKRRARA